jgi:nucleotidyltransferase substrate binding protein (TIGR01987 family)
MEKSRLLKQLEQAYSRLEEALAVPRDEVLALDGTIQRFEFTFEMAWKTLKVYLEDQGIIAHSPKGCLREAFKIGWIAEEEPWLAVLQARNMTSHVYNEEMAVDIYTEIRKNHLIFKSLIDTLREY